ncbi:hypothetical protein SPSIL_006750 [Sporomusa silvacetica DSM 10669]|uniref:Uncharacterized protein n=2 Tax=Sporomusa silvacetica TaxID=55504 RepID=A0ABZ3IGT9_9FIRM|nr:hypothetical protein SPSIL_37100 [Sporomusa silvacetica DSM 10669]
MKINFKKSVGCILACAAICISFLSTNVEAASFDPARFETIEAKGLKIHTYMTQDALGDLSIIFETKNSLLLLEPVPFHSRTAELKAYLEALHKPLKGIIVSAHNGSIASYEGVPVYASQATADELNKSIKNQLESFKSFGGEDLDCRLVDPTNILKDKNVTIEGINFEIAYHNGPLPSIDLAIPKSKVLFKHMLGADEHSIIVTREQLDSLIAELKDYEKQGYTLVLSSHHKPEDGNAITTKVAYLEQMKMIIAESNSADEFITKMKAAFPNLKGINYLNMTASFLFK